MARHRHRSAIRGARLAGPGRRLVLGLGLALAGAVAGMLLGELASGGRIVSPDGEGGSGGYARLSANPHALVADPLAASPSCLDCADSYGAAARLRAQRDERADAAFRDPGGVEPDASLPEPADDYHYGGRFPDTAPSIDTSRETPVLTDEAPPE